MSLTKKEEQQLVALMEKVEFPLSEDVFLAWASNFTTSAVELIACKGEGADTKVFLTYREDVYFKGWHIPGTVLLPGESVENALARIEAKELFAEVKDQTFFSWFERKKGTGYGQSPRGQELVLVFKGVASNKIQETDTAKFFLLSQLPPDLLSEHDPVFKKLLADENV